MKAGDIKKFLEKAISSDRRDNLRPQDFNINDNYLLGVTRAFEEAQSPEQIRRLVGGFITTEELTVQRRCAVLKMVRDVLSELARPSITKEDREHLRQLLTAYFI